MKIGFIGVGAMAKAIIKGLIASKVVTAGDINVHSAHEKKLCLVFKSNWGSFL